MGGIGTARRFGLASAVWVAGGDKTMKYETFIKLRGCGIAILVGVGLLGGCYACSRAVQRETPPISVGDSQQPQEQPQQPQEQPQQPQEPVQDANAVNDVQRKVLEMLKEPLDRGQKTENGPKWRIKEGRVAVEVRCDEGKGYTYWNRAKIDYNGNKKAEEQWSVKDGKITRRVSPGDDENYTEIYHLEGETWVRDN
jgi:hypothetical protein